MIRTVDPEILDDLPAADPSAIHSRSDLQRINTLMGNVRTMGRAVRSSNQPVRTIVELGSGDGTFLLRVARAAGLRDVRAVLIDFRPVVSDATFAGFADLGWTVETQPSDVFDWLRSRARSTADLMLANLFLHHLDGDRLAILFELASRQTDRLVACEPRRSRAAVAAASLLGLIGCNEVTRHDARVSIRAGFRGRELSGLWPAAPSWALQETEKGPFTHLFVATRRQELRSSV